jgi:hypothetical protein
MLGTHWMPRLKRGMTTERLTQLPYQMRVLS